MGSQNLKNKAQSFIGKNQSCGNEFIEDNQNIGEGRTVLVVDDDADILPLIGELLSEISFNPITVESAEEAITLLDKGLVPDLLLTDINMPGIDGFELAVKIKEVQPNIGVVYMSGFDSSIYRSYNVEVRAELLKKPFKLSALSYALVNAAPLVL